MSAEHYTPVLAEPESRAGKKLRDRERSDKTSAGQRTQRRPAKDLDSEARSRQATATGIFPIFARHSAGPDLCTALPPESTATVTGMSFTSNS